MTYRFGDLVLIDFPFSDALASKRRPALVIFQDSEEDILLARITSKPKESILDVKLNDWKQSRLLFPSTLRLGKLATLSAHLIESKIGELSGKDQGDVISALEKLIEVIQDKSIGSS